MRYLRERRKASRIAWRRIILVLLYLPILFSLNYFVLGGRASAEKLPKRSLKLADTTPGAVTTYTFSWNYRIITTLGSIRLQICTDPYFEDPCTKPDGADFSTAVLSSQTGNINFFILSQTDGEIILKRSPQNDDPVPKSTYIFDNVTNPTGPPDTFYVRVWTYPSQDATGPENEVCSVVNATVLNLNINGEVPPFLYLCVARQIADYCQESGGNFIDYGDFDSAQTKFGTSQFQIATNFDGGYVVTVIGNTMTSSNHIIDALSVPTAVQTGVAQFGLNLAANTNPAAGQNVTGVGIGTTNPTYSQSDQFLFNSGDVIASASTGSNYNTFTQTYVVNVPPDLPAGIYNTTITYVALASF